MDRKKAPRINKTIVLAGLMLGLLVIATTASAQAREGRWDFTLGTSYQLGANLNFEGGSTIDTDDDFGFLLTTGYHISDRLETSFGLNWNSVGYDATVVQDGGGTVGITGSYDSWAMSANLLFNLTDGPFVPFVGAGIGWTWIDTNIPNGLPTTGCWWDPWWGYVCYTSYPTAGTDSFSYQAMLGLRYEFNSSSFLRLMYGSKWMDLGDSNGTPRFDVIGLEFGWMF